MQTHPAKKELYCIDLDMEEAKEGPMKIGVTQVMDAICSYKMQLARYQMTLRESLTLLEHHLSITAQPIDSCVNAIKCIEEILANISQELTGIIAKVNKIHHGEHTSLSSVIPMISADTNGNHQRINTDSEMMNEDATSVSIDLVLCVILTTMSLLAIVR